MIACSYQCVKFIQNYLFIAILISIVMIYTTGFEKSFELWKRSIFTLVASHFVKRCQEERPNQNEYNIHNHKKSDKFDAHFQTIPNHCIKTTGY